MKWAKEHSDDAPDGAVFIADNLEHARGRQGRIWQLAPGQLPLTIILKPEQFTSGNSEATDFHLNYLTMALGLGIFEPLKRYGVGLKWPNDFMLEHKKVGGMLVELVWQCNQPRAVILGFALNINNSFEKDNSLGVRATSIYDVTKQQHDLDAVTHQLFTSLDQWYRVWKSKDYELIYTTWKSNQIYLGKTLTIHDKQGNVVTGIVQDIQENGDLIVKCGSMEQVIPFYIVEEVKSPIFLP